MTQRNIGIMQETRVLGYPVLTSEDSPMRDDADRILLEKLRWKGHPVCPYCRSRSACRMAEEGRYHCNKCNSSYSVIVSSFLHGTHLPLSTWKSALQVITHSPNISCRRLALILSVTKDTALRIKNHLRSAQLDSAQQELLLRLSEAQSEEENRG